MYFSLKSRNSQIFYVINTTNFYFVIIIIIIIINIIIIVIIIIIIIIIDIINIMINLFKIEKKKQKTYESCTNHVGSVK